MFSRFGISIVFSLLLLFGVGLFLSSGKSVSRSFSQGRSLAVTPETKVVPAEDSVASPVLLFGGDMMFDRYLRTVARARGGEFLLAGLAPLFGQADLVVANLEGPITDNASLSETSVVGARDNYFFTFDPSVASLLKRSHIDAVNIGNNHILNFKEEGVEQTKRYLGQAGVGFFGSPLVADNRILFREIRGAKIALVNYNQFVWQGKEKALQDIATAKQSADIVVLYTHWGTEYVPVTAPIRELAHEFIAAGADLIIGSHPHVVQEKEAYQGKMIYYSLGNLIFDQYADAATKQGLLVRATLDAKAKEFSFEDIPVTLKNDGETVLTGQ